MDGVGEAGFCVVIYLLITHTHTHTHRRAAVYRKNEQCDICCYRSFPGNVVAVGVVADSRITSETEGFARVYVRRSHVGRC